MCALLCIKSCNHSSLQGRNAKHEQSDARCNDHLRDHIAAVIDNRIQQCQRITAEGIKHPLADRELTDSIAKEPFRPGAVENETGSDVAQIPGAQGHQTAAHQRRADLLPENLADILEIQLAQAQTADDGDGGLGAGVAAGTHQHGNKGGQGDLGSQSILESGHNQIFEISNMVPGAEYTQTFRVSLANGEKIISLYMDGDSSEPLRLNFHSRETSDGYAPMLQQDEDALSVIVAPSTYLPLPLTVPPSAGSTLSVSLRGGAPGSAGLAGLKSSCAHSATEHSMSTSIDKYLILLIYVFSLGVKEMRSKEMRSKEMRDVETSYYGVSVIVIVISHSHKK